MKKTIQNNNQISFILIAGVIILCIFSSVVAVNLISKNESDSYYVKLEDDMNAKIESLDIKDSKLKITMSGDTAEYCVKSTKSTPEPDSLCWKKINDNTAVISIYQYKKYYVWIKDIKGNISIPISVNTKNKDK